MHRRTTMQRSVFRPSWLLNTRFGAVALLLFFLLALRQLILSQMELDEVKDRVSERRDDFLEQNGARRRTKIEGRTGLTAKGRDFFLNGKPLRILGGSMHYFRFPPEYWRARLLALKASGLNSVTTYVAWNAHEPVKGTFDFSGMLNLPKFIEIAHDLELHVILRIGPYICAEWEWGGLPSWLLREDDVKVRTGDPVYMNHVQNWFDKLLMVIHPYQYTYGGPVIAVQVENEYASFPNYDPQYYPKLEEMVKKGGIEEFLFVCDDRNGVLSNYKRMNYGNTMRSINFQHNPASVFEELKVVQPNWPLFVSEYWSGWFNWWGGPDHKLGVPWLNSLTTAKFESNTKELLDAGGHMNLYMFVGGTNFGFMNGGMIEPGERGKGDRTSPDTTSYDYDALISEEGKLTPKFLALRKLLQALGPEQKMLDLPQEPEMTSYESTTITSYVSLGDITEAFKSWMIKSKHPMPMEKFPAAADRKLGQAYGYALYETQIDGNPKLTIYFGGNIRDRAHVFLDAVYHSTIDPNQVEFSIEASKGTRHTVSFLVENQGRVNWVSREQPGTFENQRKGIIGDIKCNGEVVTDWRIWPLEFDGQFLKKLDYLSQSRSLVWNENKNSGEFSTPALLKAHLTLGKLTPKDTFLELEGFEKGIVIVNGINLGRYWNSAGPQKRLFLPGVWLHEGQNDILIFEESKVGHSISFHKTSGI